MRQELVSSANVLWVEGQIRGGNSDKKDDFRAVKKKQESKETWRKTNPLVCGGWYGLKT